MVDSFTLCASGNGGDYIPQYNYLMDYDIITVCAASHCNVRNKDTMKWNMLSSEDNILIKTCGNRKDKRWTTFCERCTQPVRPKALQEAVGNSHPRPADNIAVIKLKTPIKRSCKFCNFSVECSFLFPLVQSVQKFTKNMAVIIENRVARFYGPQCTCSEC